jgi:O-antigen ligase
MLLSPYVHNEYVETFAELGIGGLLLVIALLVSTARRITSGRAHAAAPAFRPGALAALAALVVHSLADFVWSVPAVLLTLAVLIGLAMPSATRGRGDTPVPVVRRSPEHSGGVPARHRWSVAP